MATKAKKKAPPANTAAPVDQSCPAEGMEHPPHKGPNPKVKGSPAPYLMVDGAIKAAEFYNRAFGAEHGTLDNNPGLVQRTLFLDPDVTSARFFFVVSDTLEPGLTFVPAAGSVLSTLFFGEFR